MKEEETRVAIEMKKKLYLINNKFEFNGVLHRGDLGLEYLNYIK
ncbi:hypothetical protein [Methanosphaera cuniculi]|nr:hypothetical protein [Methanosphaera cuniculi]